MAEEQENPEFENEETEVYEGNVYNLWMSFNNCTINTLEVRQYGKPRNPPPPPGGE